MTFAAVLSLAAVLLLASACTAPSPDASASASPPSASASASPPSASASVSPPSASASPSSCQAPSLSFAGPLDAFTADAIRSCLSLRTGQAKASLTCGASRIVDDDGIDAIAATALPLDAATRSHVVEVARRGRAAGLDPRVVGFVGDSMTVSLDFVEALSPKSRRTRRVGERALHHLGLARGGSVVDWVTRGNVDSLRIPRAARVGARVPYALAGGDASPVAKLLTTYRPAMVVIAFGANDAALRPSPPEELADDFERDLVALVAALEARGVVAIVSNEMRHLDQPGVKACPKDDPLANDWRVSIATNAIMRRTAEIACRERLPFVDLRAALEGATNHGLSPDGVHPSVHREGGGILDGGGLDCGYNIRSFVTLVAIRRVVDLLLEEGIASR